MQQNKTHSPSYYARKRFLKNKPAALSIGFIILLVFIALLGYIILPDSSPSANEQIIEIAAQKPGFSIQLLKIRNNEAEERQGLISTLMYGKKSNFTFVPAVKYKFSADSVYVLSYGQREAVENYQAYSLADVVDDVVKEKSTYAFAGNSVSYRTIYGEKKNYTLAALQKEILEKNIVTRTYYLGTDRYGRDVLSRLLLGTRISLSVGLVSVFISLLLGSFLGAMAGFFRGKTDSVIMWFISVVWSIPTLLLVISLSLILGRGFWQVFIAVGLTMWVEVARIVRGQILSVREYEYVQAGKVLGLGNARIIVLHILPAIMPPVIVISAANFAAAILLEAGLSFLGVGIQPPVPSWGMMLNEHFGYIVLDNAFLAILPGLAIMLLVLAFNFFGNGLRDAYDVKG